MALRKHLCLVICVLALNGCSVLGFATDLTLISASDRNTKPGDPSHMNNYELYFTQEGIKHHVEAVKNFMEGVSDPQSDFSPWYQEKTQTQPLACKNVADGKQQCYSAEYYADKYIKNSGSQAQQTHCKIDSFRYSVIILYTCTQD